MELRTEVCVIGSGAGGGALATELALAGTKVCLLEAGGPAPLAKLGEPVERSFFRVVRRKNAVVSVARGRPLNPIVHGRCEGGSTALNAGSAFRLPEFLNRRWQALGVPDLDPFFDRVDTFIQVSPTEETLWGRNGRLMHEGIRALGWRGGAVPRNAPGCTGRAVCVLGCPEKAKRATHLAYLPVARKHGARVLLNAPARRILFRGNRAVSVEGSFEGRPLRIVADKVAVCGGAIFTPLLLERSGVRAPGLGNDFMVHPGCVLAAHFPEPVEMGSAAVPQSVYCDEFLESERALFLLGSIPPHLTLPALTATGVPQNLFNHERTGFWGALIRDEGGRGSVRATRRGARLRYHVGEAERAAVRRSLLLLAQAAFAAGAEAVTPLLYGTKRARNLRELGRILPDPIPFEKLVGGSVHPMGTCGIGRVCEADGRVRGYENLYVADAGLFPTSIGVNPQFTIMALATAVAAQLLEN